MTEPIPRYFLRPPRADPTAGTGRFGVLAPFHEVGSVDELLGVGEHEPGSEPRLSPGWVILPPETAPDTVLDLLTRLAGEKGDWSPLALEEGEDGLFVLPLHPGFGEELEEVATRLNRGGAGTGVLSFRHLLKDLSRIRHDVNNPLTAALAEVQLLLMDVEPGSEIQGSLQAVEVQIRRIRDLISELTAFRSPLR